MSETNVNTIWRPVVRPTEVPYPNTQSRDPNNPSVNHHQQQQYLTKTSLAHDNNSNENLTFVKQMNQRILDASQWFNNTPKPFVRQSSDSRFELNKQTRANHESDRHLGDTNSLQVDDRKYTANNTMSPKLVHQQYNSPIDLYSMSNIRKTIEAHSEMIAPGVKGINFMKADAPVNKESEVLKLIKEEEEQRRIRQQQRPLPVQKSDQPLSLPYIGNPSRGGPSEPPQHRLQYAAEQSSVAQGAHYSQQQHQSQSSRQQNEPLSSSSAASLISRQAAFGNNSTNQAAPKCFECGHPIVGPFAKLQDRFIHPQCFNCSTCGTSLKNSGYFTINDKLYCDIHARQVANVMRLNYNFEPNKQAVVSSQPEISDHQRPDPCTQQVLVERNKPTATQHPKQLQQPQPIVVKVDNHAKAPVVSWNVGADQGSNCLHCCPSKGNHATTISTMFSGIGHNCKQSTNHCNCNRRSEITWTWRPANHKVEGGTCQHQISKETENTLRSSAISSRSISEHTNKHESHLTVSASSGNKTSDMIGVNGERVPVCSHCRAQIFGPYILAGKSTWCKPCSQTHFVCNSCRRSLLNIGFIEDGQSAKYNCEVCFETYLAPLCSKCNTRIRGDCLNALGKQWHPNCFVCGHCKIPFGNSSFYLEDNVPYCERDWNLLFTTKCYTCGYPIQAGDKWIEALERNYHSDCFRCTGCQVKLEGATFYCKGGKPYCAMHAR